jgi:hypothetical protein
MSAFDAAVNLGWRAARRLAGVHKPVVRAMRRREREQEHRGFRVEAEATLATLATLARGREPIIAGPWLAEVGYEVLYWIPFLRWFCDHHGVPRDRLVVVSRGGMDALYAGMAGTYADIFDVMSPAELAAGNAERRSAHEGGGQKQSGLSAADEAILVAVRSRLGVADGPVCHPSLFFRLFRHVWYGNLPMDFLWTHTRYTRRVLDLPAPPGLPAGFVAMKLYGGPALSTAPATKRRVREMVSRVAAERPVVLLETALEIDEHRDLDLRDIPNVTSAARLMTPRTNLAVQLALLTHARGFVGTCGGLAWEAPFLGVPTVGVCDSEDALAVHLFVARQAGRAAGAAPFSLLDLRAASGAALFGGLTAASNGG